MPNLQGKRDLIPGYTTSIWLQADQARDVTAANARSSAACSTRTWRSTSSPNPIADFEGWLEAMRQPATRSAGRRRRSDPRPRRVHAGAGAPRCHAIRGTERTAQVGPDLTHIASRTHTRRRNPAEHAANIAELDPRSAAVKPGNQMPPNRWRPTTSRRWSTYLETLR